MRMALSLGRGGAHLRVAHDVEELDDVDAASQVLEHLELALDLHESSGQERLTTTTTGGELAFFFLIGLRTCATRAPAARGQLGMLLLERGRGEASAP